MVDGTNTQSRQSALGAVLGALVGDAAGAVLEFVGRPIEPADVAHAMTLPGGGTWSVAPAQITDDGELTMCLLRAAAETRTRPSTEVHAFDALTEAAAVRYAEWVVSDPFDIGATTAASLGCLRSEENRARAREVGTARTMTEVARLRCIESKANGSLMRATPLGVFGARLDVPDLVAVAAADARLSHPNPACVDATITYALAIAELVRGDRNITATRKWIATDACSEVRGWFDEAASNVDPGYGPHIGFVRIAFIHAFRHFFADTPWTDAIEETLLGGGDTDTNAAIVGGLLGARDGAAAIPAAMREAVLSSDLTRGKNPRPDFLHPRDVPRLVASMM